MALAQSDMRFSESEAPGELYLGTGATYLVSLLNAAADAP